MNGIRKFKTIALDSNIFVYYFNQDPDFGPLAKEIFDKLSSNRLKAFTSIVSEIELLSHSNLTKEAVKETRRLFNSIPNLTIVYLDEKIGLKTANIRREYNFRLPDSIQLATALEAKAQAFITNDKRLKAFKELPVILLSELL